MKTAETYAQTYLVRVSNMLSTNPAIIIGTGCIAAFIMLSGCMEPEHNPAVVCKVSKKEIGWNEIASSGKTPAQRLENYTGTYLVKAAPTMSNTTSGQFELTLDLADGKVDYVAQSSKEHPESCLDELKGPVYLTLNGLDGLFDEILDGTVRAELLESHNEHVVFVATVPVEQWHGSWEPDSQLGSHVEVIIYWTGEGKLVGRIEIMEDKEDSSIKPTIFYTLAGAPKP